MRTAHWRTGLSCTADAHNKFCQTKNELRVIREPQTAAHSPWKLERAAWPAELAQGLAARYLRGELMSTSGPIIQPTRAAPGDQTATRTGRCTAQAIPSANRICPSLTSPTCRMGKPGLSTRLQWGRTRWATAGVTCERDRESASRHTKQCGSATSRVVLRRGPRTPRLTRVHRPHSGDKHIAHQQTAPP